MTMSRSAAARACSPGGNNQLVANPVALQIAVTSTAPNNAPALLPEPPMINMVQICMNSSAFISSVGAKYLSDAYGTSSGTNPTDSTRYFYQAYSAFAHIDPDSPAADRAYDAGAIVGLALAAAGSTQSAALRGAALRAAVYRVTDPKGTVIHAGKEEYGRGLALLRDGKPIRYEGVIGPVSFDAFGDISGPFRLWRIVNGAVSTIGEMSADDVGAVKQRIGG